MSDSASSSSSSSAAAAAAAAAAASAPANGGADDAWKDKVLYHWPTHVELQATDAAALKAFFEKQLGFTVADMGPPGGGPYHMLQGTGVGVAISELPAPTEEGAEKPTQGLTVPFMDVVDMDKAVEEAVALGATVTMPKMAVGEMGWCAYLTIPGGVALGYWETNKSKPPPSADDADKNLHENKVCYMQIESLDVTASRTFFEKALQWEFMDPWQDMHMAKTPTKPAGLKLDPIYVHIAKAKGDVANSIIYLESDGALGLHGELTAADDVTEREPATWVSRGWYNEVNVPGAVPLGFWQAYNDNTDYLCMFEIKSSDLAATQAFLEAGLSHGSSTWRPNFAVLNDQTSEFGIAAVGEDATSQPPPYTVACVKVKEVDAAVTKCTENGGEVVKGKFDVGEGIGSMALIKAPGGLVFSVYQDLSDKPTQLDYRKKAAHAHPVAHVGFASTDVVATSDFFAKVFDWKLGRGEQSRMVVPPKGMRVTAHFGKQDAADSVVYFETKDIDSTTKALEAAGATVTLPKFELTGDAGGHIVHVTVPGGATIGLWQRPPAVGAKRSAGAADDAEPAVKTTRKEE